MCCRVHITPAFLHHNPQEVAAAILQIGQFEQVNDLDWRCEIEEEGTMVHASFTLGWRRAIEEEGTMVHASFTDGGLALNIRPAITVPANHAGKRLAAGVMFEIAAKYAEKVGGLVIQQANIIGCREGVGVQGLVLAQYPDLPLQWDRICPGFKAVLLGEGEL